MKIVVTVALNTILFGIMLTNSVTSEEGTNIMTIKELAKEYENQYELLNSKLESLKPLLYLYKSKELRQLRVKLKCYYDLACECKQIATLLNPYGDSDKEIKESEGLLEAIRRIKED